MTVILNTLGSLIDNGHGLGVHCLNPECRRYVELDLPALAAKLGRDHGSMHRDLAPIMKCTACGQKRVKFTLLAPTPSRPRP
ncbi:Uncharacterised protein [Starkeya nomas]|uniref:Uncharacterized protein n=1 Tax=Starkeya nomas TaxID=2666134 RepID=A0A5S9R6M8_9HYPH|nr:hypothetical protein [Starkeya nomas]CAA0130295.1 Uncharacterised protein [Starkeya nomas]